MTQQTTRRRPAWLLPVIVGVVALLGIAIAYFVISSSGSDDEATTSNSAEDSGVVDIVEPEGSEQIDLSHVERRAEDDPLAIGAVDAPVTMVVFSDYQCPFCASWSHDTFPEMMDYVEDDHLRVEWRDLNVFGPESERASKAAYAAALQDSFWDYHDELFAGGDIREPSALSEDALVDLAADLDLDTDQFTEDMHSEDVAQQISENQQLGMDLGAYSTPAFVVGGEPLLGAQPSPVFVEAVDDALESAE